MRVVSAVLAGVVLAAAAGAWAEVDQSKTAARPEAPAARGDPDEVVCIQHQNEASRIPGKKECHTRRVWDQMTIDARQLLERLQSNTYQHPA